MKLIFWAKGIAKIASQNEFFYWFILNFKIWEAWGNPISEFKFFVASNLFFYVWLRTVFPGMLTLMLIIFFFSCFIIIECDSFFFKQFYSEKSCFDDQVKNNFISLWQT